MLAKVPDVLKSVLLLSMFKRFGGLMPLFFTLLAFLSYIQYIHTFLHSWTFAEAPLHFFIAEQLSGRHLPGGAESGFELGPALQRADMLPTEPCRTLMSHAAPCEPCRTLTEPCRTLLSHAAPYWAMPHPNWAMPHPTEPCRTLNVVNVACVPATARIPVIAGLTAVASVSPVTSEPVYCWNSSWRPWCCWSGVPAIADVHASSTISFRNDFRFPLNYL